MTDKYFEGTVEIRRGNYLEHEDNEKAYKVSQVEVFYGDFEHTDSETITKVTVEEVDMFKVIDEACEAIQSLHISKEAKRAFHSALEALCSNQAALLEYIYQLNCGNLMQIFNEVD